MNESEKKTANHHTITTTTSTKRQAMNSLSRKMLGIYNIEKNWNARWKRKES